MASFIPPTLRDKVCSWLDSNVYTAISTVFILIAIYADDFRLAVFAKSADFSISVILCSLFAFFFLEIVVYSLFREKYFLRFPFWLDIVATFGTLVDVGFIWDQMVGTQYTDGSNAIDFYHLTRVTKAARAGARASRMLRLIRIIMSLPIWKKRQAAKSVSRKESKVGTHLSETTARKGVLMILVISIILPLLRVPQIERSEEVALKELHRKANSVSTTPTSWASSVKYVMDYYADERPILYLKIQGQYHNISYIDANIDDYRDEELRVVEVASCVAKISYKSYVTTEATYGLISISVIITLLILGALIFDYATSEYVTKPIARLFETIEKLHKDPLSKPQLGKNKDDSETGLLERTLNKLTALLQVGLGIAGAPMIRKCLNLNTNGDLNPMVDGSKMFAIFGFCDVRRFTDTTECLQEDVMMYVNEIASIVHHHVSVLEGMPNKNIGDAFLMLWPLPKAVGQEQLDTICRLQNPTEPQLLDEDETLDLSLDDLARIQTLADSALLSVIRTLVEIPASEALQRLGENPNILRLFSDGFEVKLGFGLHVGWAIEGPIGSRFKIDASYLSPNVNLSETLEGVTKEYGVPLLMSGEFFSLLSTDMQRYCRKVDVIRVKGRVQRLQLFTVDIDEECLHKAGSVFRSSSRRQSIALAVLNKRRARKKSKFMRRFSGVQITHAISRLITRSKFTTELQEIKTDKENVSRNNVSSENNVINSTGGGNHLNAPSTNSPVLSSTQRLNARSPAVAAISRLSPASPGSKLLPNRVPLDSPVHDSKMPPRHVGSRTRLRNGLLENDGASVDKSNDVIVHSNVYDWKPPLPKSISEPKRDEQKLSVGMSGVQSLKEKSRQEREADRTLDVAAVDLYLLDFLQRKVPAKFTGIANAGVQAYVSGDWEKARELLESAAAMYAPAAPSFQPVLTHMRECNYRTPAGWSGCRFPDPEHSQEAHSTAEEKEKTE